MYADNFRGGKKFRHNHVTSQINFRGGSGSMSLGKFCKITL